MFDLNLQSTLKKDRDKLISSQELNAIVEKIFNEKAINMWIVSDNLLKGAALNSVQIAETLVKYGIK